MLHLLCSGIICLFLIGFMAKIQCWSLKLFWSLKFKVVTFSPIDDMTKNCNINTPLDTLGTKRDHFMSVRG